MPFDGATRHYLLYVPDSLASHPGARPLVIVLHGGGGTDAEVRRSTKQGFDALAEANGFLVLYPNAIGRLWDTGEGEISSNLAPRRDDTGFISAAVKQVGTEFTLDRQRIFATGVSRGGQMSYALACNTPGLIRAIAPVSMTLPDGLAPACKTGAPLGVLLIEGTADPIVPYDGGRITIFNRQRDSVLSAAATMATFASRNHCDAEKPLPPTGAVQRQVWLGCSAPLRLDRVEGGGHGWPSGRRLMHLTFVGQTNTDIDAPTEIWHFFSRF